MNHVLDSTDLEAIPLKQRIAWCESNGLEASAMALKAQGD